MDAGGTNRGGTGGAVLDLLDMPEKDATVLPCDRGRAGAGLDFRKDDERMPAGNETTGRCSALRDRFPAVRGRPLPSTDGRGPSFTFCLCTLERSRSRRDGLADWVDLRGSDAA